ncbi:MAG: 30S ribosomal protein S20 [Opitutales bacterium]|nr:30S ribosomal protein S20 [Opitutales bacterium]
MANIKSSKKDIRRIKTRTERNRVVISRIRTLRKKVLSNATAGEAGALATASGEYSSALDKAAKRGVIHHNKANRIKARVAKLAKAAAPAA